MSFASVFGILGDFAKAKSDLESAESHYRSAAEVLQSIDQPVQMRTIAYVTLSTLFMDQGRLDEADQALRKAVKNQRALSPEGSLKNSPYLPI